MSEYDQEFELFINKEFILSEKNESNKFKR